jgi:hypothetical protein
MAVIPKKAEARIRAGIKKYKGIVTSAKNRDVNESDTVTIMTDILAEICGYDKYAEITREYAIRNTYCDLAIKIEDKPIFLIEVKAIGIDLKAKHLRQALGYAANEGIEWVILTNGDHWQAHRVMFEKPIKTEIAFDFSFIETSDIKELMDYFFLVSKEGVKKSAIDVFHEESQLTGRYMIAATLRTEPVLTAIRRQLRSVSSKIKITTDDILQTLNNQVLKREVTEGEEAIHAKKRLALVLRNRKKSKSEKAQNTNEIKSSEEE